MLQLLVLLLLNSNLSVADGTGPDPTTGLCADGSQPQPQPQSQALIPQPIILLPDNNLYAVMVLDQTQPPASVLMVHNHNHNPSQSLNATAPDLATSTTCLHDGPGPDPTTGLCADGSQPQPSVPQSQSFHLRSLLPPTTSLQQTVLHLTQPPAYVLMVHNHNHSLSTFNATAPDVTTPNSNLSAATVLDQTQPPASVLMVHNHNHSIPQPAPIYLLLHLNNLFSS